MNKIKLLAPAGNMDALYSAVNFGADEVYIGGKNFSARQGANNFEKSEIKKATEYCHIYGVSIFVALNTLLSDNELKPAIEFIEFLNEIGVDGVIVQDLGMLSLIKKIAPNLEIHASTQMTIHNLDGANFLYSLGVKRVVLSRELSFDEIKFITQNSKIETEIFIHGALCVCYSGQCLMSSFIGNRSGNRGRCAQPCRLLYSANNKNNIYALSLKDLCLVEHLEQIKNIGVSSLKIEGRMKGPSFVGAVTSIYRKYLDNNIKPTEDDLNTLYSIFDRGGYTKGYSLNELDKNMFCYDKPDNPYKNQNNISKMQNAIKKIPVNMQYTLKCGEKMMLEISDNDGNCAVVFSNISAEKAINKPLTKERVELQLNKLTDTPYFLENIYSDFEQNESVIIPISEINNLRRNAVELLSQKRGAKNLERPFFNIELKKGTTNKKTVPSFTFDVSTKEQFLLCQALKPKRIYAPIGIFAEIKDFLSKENSTEIYITLPRIISDFQKQFIIDALNSMDKNKISGISVSNLGQINFVKGYGIKLFSDFGMNILNSEAVSFLESIGFSGVLLSPEMSIPKIRDIYKNIETEVIVYGKIPLMITKNCIKKCLNNACEKNIMLLRDRSGTSFPVVCNENFCYNEILNSKPVFMADKLDDINNLGIDFFRIKFTTENKSEVEKIISAYNNFSLLNDLDYTRGFFYKKLN